MPVAVINDRISFIRFELSPSEIPKLLRKHKENYPDAIKCEQQAVELIEAGFPSGEAVAFVESIVRWGGGQRFIGRLLDQNGPERITLALREANTLLQNLNSPDAVSRLQQLRYLGQSFASKIARFLSPKNAVILDDVLRSALGYRESQDGYEEFLFDCQTALTLLITSHPQLRICDVEAAIFAKIKVTNLRTICPSPSLSP